LYSFCWSLLGCTEDLDNGDGDLIDDDVDEDDEEDDSSDAK
jgi:hypothetical protein